MANTVNGVAAITARSQRETVAIEPHRFQHPHLSSILRARLNIDTVANFTVDDPTVDTDYKGQSIFIVGVDFAYSGAYTFEIFTGNKLLVAYSLAANSGPMMPIDARHVTSPGDQGQPLVINVSNVSGAAPLQGSLYYAIADRWVP